MLSPARVLTFSAVLLAAAPAFAQAQGTPTRLRGTVDAVTADSLSMTTRSGEKKTVKLPAEFRVSSVVKADLADVKPGSYIGSAAIGQADGTQKAMQVTIFPPAMRGVGEGHRPWDLGEGTTMTNGTVGDVTAAQGRTLTVTYKDGEKKIVVPEGVPVVTFEPGTRALIVPGAQVIVNASAAADGTLTAGSVSVGKDLVPPM